MPLVAGLIHDPVQTGLLAERFRDPQADGRAPTPSGRDRTALGRIAPPLDHPWAPGHNGPEHTPSCTRESAIHPSGRTARGVQLGICLHGDVLEEVGTCPAIDPKGAGSAVQNMDRPFPCIFRS